MRHLCRQIHSGKKGNLKQQQQRSAVIPPVPPAPQGQSAQPSQQLQQLLASASAPQIMPNLTSSSLLGSSLLSPESMLLTQMTSLLQQQQQQQQQLATVNALAQHRLADLLALSQLDAARSQLQLGGGGLQSLLAPQPNTTSTLQSLLALQNDPLALALAQQDQRMLLQSPQGGLSDLQRQILLAQVIKANSNNNGLLNFTNQR